jgi:hypothetical protein
MQYLIAALTHCAANENEQKMSNLVARFNANSFYQAHVGTLCDVSDSQGLDIFSLSLGASC